MSSPLTRFPFFPSLARRIRIDGDERLELSTRNLEPDLLEAVLCLTTPCCRCGDTIHPFRRRGRPERLNALTGNVYVSLVCPQSVKPGCSRGRDAEAAKAALIDDVLMVYDADNAEFLPAILR